GRLRRQRGRARDARVDLDHVVLEGLRVQGELYVAAALDTERADDLQARRPEHLVLLIRERLRRRYDDGVPRVDAHRIQVLHVTDGDTGVVGVPHHLVLDLFPATEEALHHHLVARRETHPALADLDQLFRRVRDTAAGAAQRVGGADDER